MSVSSERQTSGGHAKTSSTSRATRSAQPDGSQFRITDDGNNPLYLRGVLDTSANVKAWLGTKPIFGKLIFKTVGIDPFIGSYVQDKVIHQGHIVCCGRVLSEAADVGMTPGKLRDARLLLVGEIMTPVKPTGMDLPPNEAREAYIAAVDALRTGSNLSYICDGSREGFLQAGGSEEEWTETPLSEGTAIKLMAYFATCKLSQPPLSPVAMITYAFVAMSKRGIVSEEFCTKIVEGIRQDVGTSMTMSAEVIKLMWTYYGDVIDDIVAENLFSRWKDELPANALRLRITLEQTLNTGLTTLIVTVRGVADHPTFPWDRLIELSPFSSEMAALKHAVETVGNNKYYGYRKDLGDARGTLYKNLSYVAKELLVKVNGETALNRYAGFPRRPAQAPIVNSMIEAYINRLNAFGQDPEKNPLSTPSSSEVYKAICELRNRYITVYQHATTM